MCSYCGCRDIPMIATLNAEHDYIGSPDQTFTKPVEWSGQMIFPANLGNTEVIGNIYENPELVRGMA